MTPTDNIHTLSGAYALDALDDLERVRFEAHMETCYSCAEEVASFQATSALLGGAEELPVSSELRSAVLDEIQHVRQVGPVTARVTRVAPRLVSVAAAVLAVAVVSLSVVTRSRQKWSTASDSRPALATSRPASLPPGEGFSGEPSQ